MTKTNDNQPIQELPETDKNSSGTPVVISPSVVRQFVQGNHRAYETIFNTFYGRVKTFIYVIIKDEDTAEDLTQQLFIDLWLNRENINPDKNFNAYMYTIARNNTITALKQQVKLEPIEIKYNLKDDTTLTDGHLIARETELLVQLTVAAMPPKRRQVYEMSRYEDKTNEEIAGELKISRKVVEKHLRLALKKLREVIGILVLFF